MDCIDFWLCIKVSQVCIRNYEKKKKSDVRLVKIDYFFCWKRCVRFEIKCGHRAFFERYCSFRFISVVVTSYNELINLHDVQFMNECVQLKTAHRDFNKKKNKIVYHIYYPCLSSAQNVCCIQNTRPHIITEYTKCGFSLFINEKSAFFYWIELRIYVYEYMFVSSLFDRTKRNVVYYEWQTGWLKQVRLTFAG